MLIPQKTVYFVVLRIKLIRSEYLKDSIRTKIIKVLVSCLSFVALHQFKSMELPQTYNIWSNSINSLKYLSYDIGIIYIYDIGIIYIYDIGIRKSEFVTKTQFPLSLNSCVVDQCYLLQKLQPLNKANNSTIFSLNISHGEF